MATWQLAAAGSIKHADKDLTYMCQDCKKKKNYPNKKMPLSVSSNAQVWGGDRKSGARGWVDFGPNSGAKHLETSMKINGFSMFLPSWLNMASGCFKLASSWLKLASNWLKSASSWPQVGLKLAQLGFNLPQLGF